VNLSKVRVGRTTSLTTGDGANAVTIDNARFADAFSLATGDGADAVTIDDTVFTDDFNLTTGGGDDMVRVEGQRDPSLAGPAGFRGRVTVELGQGDDELHLGVFDSPARLVRLFDTARFDGGPGSDLRDDANVERGNRPVTFVNFERTPPPPLFHGPVTF